jgi:hypothetical protein
MEEIISNCRKDLGWIYETNPSDNQSSSFLGKTKGYINYTVWSKVVICPHCGISIVVWDRTITYDFDKSIGSVIEKPTCQKCGINLDIAKCEPEIEHVFVDGKVCETQKYIPVLINYTYGGKRLEKTPSQQDLELINKISNTAIPGWYPKNKMMNIGEKWGDSYRAGYHKGITRVDDFLLGVH